MDFLKDIENSPGLLPAEHKAASQLLRLLERAPDRTIDLQALFAQPPVSHHDRKTFMSFFARTCPIAAFSKSLRVDTQMYRRLFESFITFTDTGSVKN